MKYIRTANGIYTSTLDSVLANMRPRYKDIYLRRKNGENFEDIAKDYGLSPWTIRSNYGTARNHVNFSSQRLLQKTGKVIKEADTIEELCDEFVGISRLGAHYRFLRSPSEQFIKDYFKEVYGAVWCEFGLKYVAKINKEGKLELL